MSHIFYKFKSAKDYDSYKFEGAGIPVWELKKEIVLAKNLGKSNDFDLLLTNAQTNEDYTEDMTVIPRNAQIVVKRVPATAMGGKRPNAAMNRPAMTFMNPVHGVQGVHLQSRPVAPPLGGANEEESRIRAMMSATGSHWEQNQQDMPLQQTGPKRLFRPVNWRGPIQTPPETYVCYRCGQKGHYIQHCSTNNDPTFDKSKVRRTTGIPKSFLKPVTADAAAAAASDPNASFLVTPEGNLVMTAPNEKEWDRLNTIRTISEEISSIPVDEIPFELKCTLCGQLLRNSVRVPCCASSFCDECVRGLFDDESAPSIPCPTCTNPLTIESVVPDIEKRNEVNRFIESYGLIPEPAPEVPLEKTPKTVLPRGIPPGFPPLPFPFPGFLPPGLFPMGFMPPPPPPRADLATDRRRDKHRRFRSRSTSRSRSKSRSRSRSRSPSRSKSPKRAH